MFGLLIPKGQSKRVFYAKADVRASAANSHFVREGDISRCLATLDCRRFGDADEHVCHGPEVGESGVDLVG